MSLVRSTLLFHKLRNHAVSDLSNISFPIKAGGSSADVSLCDLRMADGASKRVVQRYRPSTLSNSDNVSVSGLDLSRDKQELLVSYESDQIYTFPVFPQVKSRAGPTLDEMREIASATEDESIKVLEELAAYGGHLNRFTFLKVCEMFYL
jgi:hypothetical protein